MATRGAVKPEMDESWGAVPAGATPPALPDDVAEQSPIERVMAALQDEVEPGKRVRVQLFRLVPDSPGKPLRAEWCVDLTPDEFEAGGLGAIRDTWGSGGYEVRLMGYKRGSNYFTRVAAPRFYIAPLPGNGMQRPESNASSGVEAALRALADSQSRLFEMMVERNNAPAPAPADPMAQMKQFLEMQVLMREASGANAPAAAQKSSIGEIVDAIKELKEVSSIVNPGEQPEKSTLEQIVELATPLVAMAQQALQQRQLPAQAAHTVQSVAQAQLPVIRTPNQFAGAMNEAIVQRPTSAPSMGISSSTGVEVVRSQAEESQTSQAQPAVSEAESENQEVILNELQSYLAQLVSMAEKGESIEKGAELVYDKLPDDWIELLHMQIWWDALKSAAPEVEKHEAWVRGVRDEVVRMFAEDTETPEVVKPL